MELWNALEAAVRTRDWGTATKLAQLYADEWPDVRDLVLLFAGEGAQAWAKSIDDVVADLIASLEARPVDATVVERVMARARVFVIPDTLAGRDAPP